MSEKTIIVTGGASGMGAETVDMLHADGHKIIVVDRNPSLRNDLTCVRMDLMDPGSIQAAVEQLPSGIDCVVNAAGVAGTSGVEAALTVNFIGLRAFTDAIAAKLAEASVVVTIASTVGYEWRSRLEGVKALMSAANTDEAVAAAAPYLPEGREGFEAYNLAKSAAVVWSSISSRAYGPGVRTVTVSPGPSETPLLKDFYESIGDEALDRLKDFTGRHGTPADIARVIRFLISDEADWISGVDIVADGGAEGALLRQRLLEGVSNTL